MHGRMSQGNNTVNTAEIGNRNVKKQEEITLEAWWWTITRLSCDQKKYLL